MIKSLNLLINENVKVYKLYQSKNYVKKKTKMLLNTVKILSL